MVQKSIRQRLISMFVSLTILFAIVAVGLMMMSLMARRPGSLGVTEDRLAECPQSPNCVCSQSASPEHQIAPLSLTGDPGSAIAGIADIVRSMPRTTIVRQTDRYLHVEFRSRLFRFPDDVEFLVDADAKVIHVRSASRVGHSDLGVNRARVEEIRRQL
jgi:uncharacterized protein (DUF1499 family)